MPPLCPTPGAEEVKEVTILQNSSQVNIQIPSQHIPIVTHQNPPENLPLLPPMVVSGFILNKYASLALHQVLNDMPQDYLKLFPRFTEEDITSFQKHIEDFCVFAENVDVEHLDVVLIIFVEYLDGEARKWFKYLPNNAVATCEEMENYFTKKWGEKRDHDYILTNLNALKKKHNEDVMKFIKRFNKLYNNLPNEIKPPQAVAKVVFSREFESKFGFTLREINSTSLDEIQTNF